jgi:hypothetical protein
MRRDYAQERVKTSVGNYARGAAKLERELRGLKKKKKLPNPRVTQDWFWLNNNDYKQHSALNWTKLDKAERDGKLITIDNPFGNDFIVSKRDAIEYKKSIRRV